MIEEWFDIPGYNGQYQITYSGKIRSKNRCSDPRTPQYCILKEIISSTRYKRVKLKNKLVYTHRLLAITFIQNPLNKPEVNHIDGNRGNFSLNNLEWVTHKENFEHARLNKLWEPKKKKIK